MRVRMLALVLATIVLCSVPRMGLAQNETAPQAKVQQLIDLLNDPEVRAILATKAPDAVSPPDLSLMSGMTGFEAAVRDRFSALRQAVTRIPDEIDDAARLVVRDVNAGRPGTVVAILAALIAVGLAGDALVRRALPGSGRRIERKGTLSPSALLLGEVLPLLVFIALTVGTFLIFDWPPLLRRIVLTYLVAFIAFRALTATARLLAILGHKEEASLPEQEVYSAAAGRPNLFWYGRTRLFLAFLLFAWATANLLPELGFSTEVVQLLAYVFGLGLLGIAIEAVWHRPRIGEQRSPAKDALLTLYLGCLWVVWVAGLYGLLWLGIYALVLPPILSATGRAAAFFGRGRNGRGLLGAMANVLIVRGVRALVIALAIGWLTNVWRFSIAARAGGERVAALIDGLLQGLVILLVADLLWEICKAIIERQVQTSDATVTAAEAARKSRLRTLLPLFRNTLAVFIAVVTVLTVLSGLGVAIGPLIAGAGIFGVAIGFGSQTLVKDILSGVFFMLDDAFRVGEYIQSGSYKGTVESFSLRSVRLRHHRGPIFTVPFGDLGAVQNMSRDWVIDKMTINVTYDTDVDKARKLIKKVGQELAEDPEFAANTIEPLKMQGVESFGDFAIVLRMKLMTKPGEQFRIKRKAFVMIKKAFDENGVKIATPTVQVSGDDKGAGPAAVEAMRLRKNHEAQALAVE